MKQLHELASIKDGNKRVGYVMKVGGPEFYSKWYLADEAAFAKTVREGKVQYFESDEKGNPIIKYTNEELNFFAKLGTRPLYGTQYWSQDMSYKKQSIDYMMSRNAVILNPLRVMNLGIVKQITFTAFMKSSVAENFYNFITRYLGNSMYISTLRNGGNNFSFATSMYDIDGSNSIFIKAKESGLELITDVNTLCRLSDNSDSTSVGISGLLDKVALNKNQISTVISKLRKYEIS